MSILILKLFALDASYTWPDVPPDCSRLLNIENCEWFTDDLFYL